MIPLLWNQSLTCLAVTLTLLGAAGDSPFDCPNSGVKEVASKVTYGPTKSCGSGLNFRTGPVQLHHPKRECPTFALIEPVHHLPTPKLGHRTSPGGKLPILLITFECADRWLFWLIPTGSECIARKTVNAGSVQNYVESACRGETGGRGKLGGGR